MAIAAETIDEIKSRVSIVELAAERMKLVKRGGNYVACCPFHNEKTPSLTLYPKNNSFYCFGCGEGGDVISFVRKLDNLLYTEAVEALAGRAGIEISAKSIGLAAREGALQDRIRACNREAARFYYQWLKGSMGKEGRQYLMDERGLDADTIRHFGLGYAPAGYFQLVNHLRGCGFTDEELITANLAFQSKKGRIIDRFQNRVMLPIFDATGNVIGFGGRALSADEPAKYINTNTTPVFQKSKELYGFNFVRKARPESIVLVEGYMDVIALHRAGFQNATASLGTALTEEQARLLARNCKEVIVCFDGDAAGRKATLRAIQMLRATQTHVRVAHVPGAKDADEFLRQHPKDGVELLTEVFGNAQNDTEYRLESCKLDLSLTNAADRLKYTAAAVEVLATLTDAVEQDIFAAELAKEVGIGRESILSQAKALTEKGLSLSSRQEINAAEMLTDSTEPTQRYHAFIRPIMDDESDIVAFADVVINEDYRINGIRLVLDKDDSLSLLMPAYRARGKEEWVPYVELSDAIAQEMTAFLAEHMSYDTDVEVVGGGTAIDVGETKIELRKAINRGSIAAYVDLQNEAFKLKFSKVVNGAHGLFVVPPDVGTTLNAEGKKQYRYAYEFACASERKKKTGEIIEIYQQMEEEKKRVMHASLKKEGV